MFELAQFVLVVNALVMPLIGITALVLSKVSQGEGARRAERNFLVTLVLITVLTLRTVIHCDDLWLVHTMTLAVMIVGALLIPSQDSPVATSRNAEG